MLINRWWRSRGFGIHSPLAFRLITRVLCDEGADYYAFARINRLCADKRQKRQAHRLYKMLVAVPVSDIAVVGEELPAGIREALRATALHPGSPHATVTFRNGILALLIDDKTAHAPTLTIEGRHDIYILRLQNAPQAHIKIL